MFVVNPSLCEGCCEGFLGEPFAAGDGELAHVHESRDASVAKRGGQGVRRPVQLVADGVEQRRHPFQVRTASPNPCSWNRRQAATVRARRVIDRPDVALEGSRLAVLRTRMNLRARGWSTRKRNPIGTLAVRPCPPSHEKTP